MRIHSRKDLKSLARGAVQIIDEIRNKINREDVKQEVLHLEIV